MGTPGEVNQFEKIVLYWIARTRSGMWERALATFTKAQGHGEASREKAHQVHIYYDNFQFGIDIHRTRMSTRSYCQMVVCDATLDLLY
jgi:hypothetical protein